jgi:hypothetical protein
MHPCRFPSRWSHRAATQRRSRFPRGGDGTFQTDPFPITAVSSPAGIVTGNGRLEVIEGDTLTATYNDSDPSGNTAEATAIVSCAADVRIVRYYFIDSNCASDGDTVADFPDLPGFLDAGERAELVVEIANQTLYDIEDVVLTAACDNPDVLLAPTGALSLGTLKARIGTNLNPAVATFHMAASNSVGSGEIANITFSLSAPGFRGVTAPLGLSLDLNEDYLLVPGEQFHEDFEGATAADWVHGSTDPANPNDEWALVSCDSHSPTHSYHNGGTDCSDYSDDQGDPFLASPAVDLFPPGTVAARVTGLDFFQNVDLGGLDFSSFTEGDLVGVGLTEADVASQNFVTLAIYGNIPFAGLDDNTNGAWVEQSLSVAPTDTLGLDLRSGVRAGWVFIIDALGDSPTTDIVGNGYYLDDVTLTYDRVETTPQVTACGKACNAVAWADAVPNPVCRGQSPVLDASQSGVLDCPDGAEFRWTDGAGFDTGFAAGNVTATPPAPLALTTYTLEVRCSNLGTPCSDSMDVTVDIVDSLPDPTPTVGNALKVTKGAAGVVRFDWSSALTAPEYFNLHHTSDPLLLADTPAAIGSTPAVPVDQAKTVDLTNPTDTFYEVWPRNGCTNVSVIP